MPSPLSPLPGELGDTFSVAKALKAGVPRWRLYTSDLEIPFSGVRTIPTQAPACPATADKELLTRMKLLAPGLREEAFFSHASAAALWQIPLPSSAFDAIDVSVVNPTRPLRRKGVRAHRVNPELVRVVEHEGLRVTDPASTWAQLASMLTFRDLVAAGDAIVLAKEQAGPYDTSENEPSLATLADLKDAAAQRHPSAKTLRSALPLVRTNAWSRPETHVRLLLTEAGLPEPELNYNVFDEIGHWVKCVDLAYPKWRIAIEYQSAYHREAKQYSKDLAALSALSRLGWYTVQLTSDHVFAHPNMTKSMVSEAITAQQRRPLYAPTRPELPT